MSTSAEFKGDVTKNEKRVRVQVAKFEVEVKEKKELEIGTGSGVPLGDIPVILYYINTLNGEHDLLKALHKIMYGGTGKGTMRKRQLRKFNGFPAEEGKASKIATTMKNSKAWNTKPCKELCQFFDIDCTGDKDTLIERAVEFLMKPKNTGTTELNDEGVPLNRIKVKKIKKRIRVNHSESEEESEDESEDDDESEPEEKEEPVVTKKEKKKKEKKVKKPKKKKAKKEKKSVAAPAPVAVTKAPKGTPSKSGKPKSAKFLYIAARKDAAKIEYPELQGTALAMKLIGEFNSLDADTKASYEKQAAEEKAAWEEAKALADEFADM